MWLDLVGKWKVHITTKSVRNPWDLVKLKIYGIILHKSGYRNLVLARVGSLIHVTIITHTQDG